jgi:hypothetical protein
MNNLPKFNLLLIAFLFLSVNLTAQVKSQITSGKEKTALFAKQIQMKALSPYKDLKWQFVGPTNISGRCTDVEAMSPGQIRKYYMPVLTELFLYQKTE